MKCVMIYRPMRLVEKWFWFKTSMNILLLREIEQAKFILRNKAKKTICKYQEINYFILLLGHQTFHSCWNFGDSGHRNIAISRNPDRSKRHRLRSETQVDQSDNWVSSDPISILSESDRIISDYIGSWWRNHIGIRILKSDRIQYRIR
jgi:hypothetical protein